MFQSKKWILIIGNSHVGDIIKHIPEVKRLWDKWNLRTFILFSIAVQIFLLFSAPLRKKTASKAVITIIWAGYLIADWAASFAVGLVFDSEEKYTSSGTMNETASLFVMMNNGTVSPIRDDTGVLLVMWTPFLLLLVGGQDRITSFAVEDNELWLRHLIWLLLQVLTTGFVFYQSFHLNKLWRATIFLLLAGAIKYTERIAALYLASSDSFGISVLGEADPGPNYERLMSVYTHYKGNNLPIEIERVDDVESQSLGGGNNSKQEDDLNPRDLVHYAHYYANIYKGLIVNLMFSSREHSESREFFGKRDEKETLKILEIQLNYFYDLLHSKVVVATSKIGIITRGMCNVLVVSAFSLFHIDEKRTFQPFDVGVTYALFGAVFGLDMATLLIWFYSDWTVASLKNFDKESRRFKIIEMLLFPKKEMREKPRSEDSLLFKFINKLLFPKKKTEEQSNKDSLLFKFINKLLFLRKKTQEQPNKDSLRFKIMKPLFAEKQKQEQPNKDSLRSKIMKLLFPEKQSREQPRGPGNVFSRRWSENLSQFDFLYYCYQTRPSRSDHIRESGCLKVYSILGQLKEIVEYFIYFIHLIINYLFYYLFYFYFPRVVRNFIDQKKSDLIIQLGFVTSYHFDPRLWEFIFNELKEKSDFADDQEEAKRISSARGEWILENSDFFDYSISSELMPYVKNVAYDESLLLWHIATEICYNTDEHSHQLPDGPLPSCEYCDADCCKKCRMAVKFWKDPHSRKPSSCDHCSAREFSKRLSDYMFYLLYQQQGMMSEVSGISKQRFNDTRSEAQRFFSEYEGTNLANGCRKILEVNTSVKPVHVKGDRSKSVLFDACMLAKEINKLRPEIKWKVTSKVWVELLSYAASRSKAKAHVQQLSKGGELITFVWLLMAQLGLKEHAWVEIRTRAKLNLHK